MLKNPSKNSRSGPRRLRQGQLPTCNQFYPVHRYVFRKFSWKSNQWFLHEVANR